MIRKLKKNKYDLLNSSIASELKNLLNECVVDRRSEKPLAAEWTSALDRGGLLFISQECYDLFLSIEKCAATTGDELPNYRIALEDGDVDEDVLRLAFTLSGDYTTNALNVFKEDVVKEFYGLRGKALARRLTNTAQLANDAALRTKLQRQEQGRDGDN